MLETAASLDLAASIEAVDATGAGDDAGEQLTALRHPKNLLVLKYAAEAYMAHAKCENGIAVEAASLPDDALVAAHKFYIQKYGHAPQSEMEAAAELHDELCRPRGTQPPQLQPLPKSVLEVAASLDLTASMKAVDATVAGDDAEEQLAAFRHAKNLLVLKHAAEAHIAHTKSESGVVVEAVSLRDDVLTVANKRFIQKHGHAPQNGLEAAAELHDVLCRPRDTQTQLQSPQPQQSQQPQLQQQPRPQQPAPDMLANTNAGPSGGDLGTAAMPASALLVSPAEALLKIRGQLPPTCGATSAQAACREAETLVKHECERRKLAALQEQRLVDLAEQRFARETDLEVRNRLVQEESRRQQVATDVEAMQQGLAAEAASKAAAAAAVAAAGAVRSIHLEPTHELPHAPPVSSSAQDLHKPTATAVSLLPLPSAPHLDVDTYVEPEATARAVPSPKLTPWPSLVIPAQVIPHLTSAPSNQLATSLPLTSSQTLPQSASAYGIAEAAKSNNCSTLQPKQPPPRELHAVTNTAAVPSVTASAAPVTAATPATATAREPRLVVRAGGAPPSVGTLMREDFFSHLSMELPHSLSPTTNAFKQAYAAHYAECEAAAAAATCATKDKVRAYGAQADEELLEETNSLLPEATSNDGSLCFAKLYGPSFGVEDLDTAALGADVGGESWASPADAAAGDENMELLRKSAGSDVPVWSQGVFDPAWPMDPLIASVFSSEHLNDDGFSPLVGGTEQGLGDLADADYPSNSNIPSELENALQEIGVQAGLALDAMRDVVLPEFSSSSSDSDSARISTNVFVGAAAAAPAAKLQSSAGTSVGGISLATDALKDTIRVCRLAAPVGTTAAHQPSGSSASSSLGVPSACLDRLDILLPCTTLSAAEGLDSDSVSEGSSSLELRMDARLSTMPKEFSGGSAPTATVTPHAAAAATPTPKNKAGNSDVHGGVDVWCSSGRSSSSPALPLPCPAAAGGQLDILKEVGLTELTDYDEGQLLLGLLPIAGGARAKHMQVGRLPLLDRFLTKPFE